MDGVQEVIPSIDGVHFLIPSTPIYKKGTNMPESNHMKQIAHSIDKISKALSELCRVTRESNRCMQNLVKTIEEEQALHINEGDNSTCWLTINLGDEPVVKRLPE